MRYLFVPSPFAGACGFVGLPAVLLVSVMATATGCPEDEGRPDASGDNESGLWTGMGTGGSDSNGTAATAGGSASASGTGGATENTSSAAGGATSPGTAATAGTAGGVPGACKSQAECLVARGYVCDTDAGMCVENDVDRDTTGPATTDFDELPLPFFRGELCVPTQVKSGAKIPVTLTPCLHPCLSVDRYNFRHAYTCQNGSCLALATMWVWASGKACPDDVFARFDASKCVKTTTADFELGPIELTGGKAYEGKLTLEIPYLSNKDLVRIGEAYEANTLTTALLQEVVAQYPVDPTRTRSLDLGTDEPAPPASCKDSDGCVCMSVSL